MIHYFLLDIPLDRLKTNKVSKLRIKSIKTIGEIDKKKPGVFLKEKPISKKGITNKKIQTNQLAPDFNSPIENFSKKTKVTNSYNPPTLNNGKAIKALSLSNKNVTQFLRGTPNEKSASSYLKTFESTQSLVKLEVPRGVKESELNKHELVFYSFQKRTAQIYINSFHKKLGEFNLRNPHLKFPLTEKKEQMVGRVIYDKDGNIIKIKMIQWTKVQKLQDFFLDVLKEMNSLPNPPKMILENNQFTIFFALTINT